MSQRLKNRPPAPPADSPAKQEEAVKPDGSLMAGLIGAGFGLILLKVVNPVVLTSLFNAPRSVGELISQPWPLNWGLGILLALVCVGALGGRLDLPRPAWAFWVPAAWLAWQFLAAWRSVDPELSGKVLRHFTALVLCFYLGWLVLGRLARQRPFWLGLLVAFGLMLGSGLLQNYGELEATKRFVEQQEQAGWRGLGEAELTNFIRQGVLVWNGEKYQATEEFLKRVRGGRVFATFAGYPNALAAAILLLLPAMITVVWEVSSRWPSTGRLIPLALLGYLSAACLYWSGSKSGWLIALLIGGLALLHLPFPKRLKLGVVTALLVLGGAAFAYKYADYFQRGATSVGARWACWQVAGQTARQHPLLGTGPGTFGRVYQEKKQPGAEMAHLAHNDYLEQASDSGWPGFVLFLGLFPAGLAVLYRGSRPETGGWPVFSVWLGLVSWAVFGLVEFSLYVPALAWVAWLMLGWLWAQASERIPVDKPADGH